MIAPWLKLPTSTLLPWHPDILRPASALCTAIQKSANQHCGATTYRYCKNVAHMCSKAARKCSCTLAHHTHPVTRRVSVMLLSTIFFKNFKMKTTLKLKLNLIWEYLGLMYSTVKPSKMCESTHRTKKRLFQIYFRTVVGVLLNVLHGPIYIVRKI
jgi:hypothetical protein